jgi:Pyruvate/2-oxoacid:ferredoxin oxidoreductase delta subunit
MNIELKYFSGTGNSYKIIHTCEELFKQHNHNTILSSITSDIDLTDKADLIGFCFPVYAFGIPRICRNYLRGLPKFQKPQKAFIIITAGEQTESGFSIPESTKLLRKKGVDVVYSAVVQMPSNWTVSMNPPSKAEARSIIDNGVNKAKEIAKKIMEGLSSYHIFNYPPRYSKFGFYKDYYLFKTLGISNLWRMFRTDDTCDSCKLCSKICSTSSIKMVDNKPKWQKTCEQCMRCVNYCPNHAIYQKGEGSVKNRNIYYEPTFKPLITEKHEPGY